MSQKPRAPASFQSLKSLPADYRFSGLPASDRFGKSDGGIWETVNDDSPYSGNTISIEDGPSRGDEDLDSVAPSLPSISSSHRERRWGDTTPYAVKKEFM
ncbi:myosin-1 [Prunus yedoensis var. nudiflora]|uniref:Myosin-1 n=1 Tax=Prunus yedoensis var. nudiflora TaxID=2094558 RepID=A0A314Y3D5_PRUYE|nr:myosin-1 [Prunus yedoensis var. nudiflora]